MIITCVSDLHGYHPPLPGGDLLIVAGDLTARDEPEQHIEFEEWLDVQGYKKKIVIAGNHDGNICSDSINCLRNCIYLLDSGTEYEGLKIWGSPWTPTFCNWHFMLPRGKPLKEKWDLIPNDTDILITHGPAWGTLDVVHDENVGLAHKGCHDLMQAVHRVRPKLHVFGHVHEGYGQLVLKRPGYGDENNTICINASIMDMNYNPVNKPITLEI